jgi:hypothetical protein
MGLIVTLRVPSRMRTYSSSSFSFRRACIINDCDEGNTRLQIFRQEETLYAHVQCNACDIGIPTRSVAASQNSSWGDAQSTSSACLARSTVE